MALSIEAKAKMVAWIAVSFLSLVVVSCVSYFTGGKEVKQGSDLIECNSIAKYGADGVEAAIVLMEAVRSNHKVSEYNGRLEIEMVNFVDEKAALLKVAKKIADADAVLNCMARTIYFFDPNGKKVAQADSVLGVRLTD
ncbi:hypothetical protein [Chromobacterium haemolyticum]|uniref:hypothetical protein n=1 Tax=Chromobacterium haemolyticum TaxID=394935 RepID=UPI0011309144|nr:hypothetical protein [Chromobacterium haemolyticum]